MKLDSGIGRRIKKLRKEKNLTQKSLSNAIGVSTQVISNWEREYTYPDYEDLLNLANYFEYPIEFILTGEIQDIGEKLPVNIQLQLNEVDIEDLFMEDIDFYFRNEKLTKTEIEKIIEIIKLILKKE